MFKNIFFILLLLPTFNQFIFSEDSFCELEIQQLSIDDNGLDLSDFLVLESHTGRGLYSEDVFPNIDSEEIIYKRSNLYLLNFVKPKNRIFVEAVDPEGNVYSIEIDSDSIIFKDYLYYSEERQNYITNENSSIIAIPFYAHSYLISGQWKISIIIDNRELVEKNIEVEVNDIQVQRENRFLSVFEENNFDLLRIDNDFFIYGNNEYPESEILFGLYETSFPEMNEYRFFEFTPIFLTTIKTDEFGRYCVHLELNDEIEKESLYIVHGQEYYSDVFLKASLIFQ